MSVKAASWVWEHSRSEGGARLVLLSLADHAGADGGDSWPSIARLCQRTKLTDRGVQKALRQLQALGELEVVPNEGPRRVNRYRLTFITALDPEQSSPPNRVHPRTECGETPNNLRGNPEQSSPGTVIEPSVNRQETRDAAVAFDAFWRAYPKRIGKRGAEKAWRSALKRGANAEQIIAAAVAYRDDPARKPDYTAHPTTWLNQGRYDDEPAEAQPALVYTGTTRYDD